ncbi:MAG: Ig-like domain-containing protein, partial [Acidimicrobiia bacterium]
MTTSDSFTYTVADDQGVVSNIATVSIQVGVPSIVTSGLVLHLETDQGLVSSAGTVMSWADQSGMGNDLVAFGAPQEVVSAGATGHVAVDFDGVDDKLERTLSLNGFPAGNADRTVILVANYRGPGFGGFAYGEGACNQAFGAIVDAAGNLTAQGWCPSNDFPTNVAGAGAGWLVQTVALEGGMVKHYRDGVLLDTQPHTFNTILSKMALGAEIIDLYFIDMQVAAVLVYDHALTSAEQQQVQDFLQNKYVTSTGGDPGNQSPVAGDNSASVGTGGSVNIAVLGNDSDPDGTLDTTTVTIVTPPANGTVLDDGAGLLTYTHDGSVTTSDSFTYTVADD